MGDLVVTCWHRVGPQPPRGELIARGASREEAKAEIGMVVEGLTTAPVLRDLSHRLGVELPITEGVCAVLDGHAARRPARRADGARPDRRVGQERSASGSLRRDGGRVVPLHAPSRSPRVIPTRSPTRSRTRVLDAVLRGRSRGPRRLRDADHDGPRRRRGGDHDDDVRRHPAPRPQDGRGDRLHAGEVRLRRRDLRRDRRARRAVAGHRAGRRRVLRGAARPATTTRSTASAPATRE